MLGQFATDSATDIIYIAADGVELANMASLVEYMYPALKVLRPNTPVKPANNMERCKSTKAYESMVQVTSKLFKKRSKL